MDVTGQKIPSSLLTQMRKILTHVIGKSVVGLVSNLRNKMKKTWVVPPKGYAFQKGEY